MKMETVIEKMSVTFARQGVPEDVLTDNGTQFNPFHESKVFKKFQETYGFHLSTRSPSYPQSNRLAKLAVKIAKKIFLKEKDLYKSKGSLQKPEDLQKHSTRERLFPCAAIYQSTT